MYTGEKTSPAPPAAPLSGIGNWGAEHRFSALPASVDKPYEKVAGPLEILIQFFDFCISVHIFALTFLADHLAHVFIN
jgi:hypothetical protein